uniref:Uncharacterized protein n=2 Tax=Clytia hemisphaerica TaxID=252671 RepID=A0A7M6DPH8_9CNID
GTTNISRAVMEPKTESNELGDDSFSILNFIAVIAFILVIFKVTFSFFILHLINWLFRRNDKKPEPKTFFENDRKIIMRGLENGLDDIRNCSEKHLKQMNKKIDAVDDKTKKTYARMEKYEKSLNAFKKETTERFQRIEGRFQKFERRFNSTDERFQKLDDKLKSLDRKFQNLGEKFEDKLGSCEGIINTRIDGLNENIMQRIDDQIVSFSALCDLNENIFPYIKEVRKQTTNSRQELNNMEKEFKKLLKSIKNDLNKNRTLEQDERQKLSIEAFRTGMSCAYTMNYSTPPPSVTSFHPSESSLDTSLTNNSSGSQRKASTSTTQPPSNTTNIK